MLFKGFNFVQIFLVIFRVFSVGRGGGQLGGSIRSRLRLGRVHRVGRHCGSCSFGGDSRSVTLRLIAGSLDTNGAVRLYTFGQTSPNWLHRYSNIFIGNIVYSNGHSMGYFVGYILGIIGCFSRIADLYRNFAKALGCSAVLRRLEAQCTATPCKFLGDCISPFSIGCQFRITQLHILNLEGGGADSGGPRRRWRR